MKNSRDGAVDIMMTMGIIFVVMGHNYQPASFFFPAYMFHVPLFFFISGYLFSVKAGVSEKLNFAGKKVVTQIIPYFIFELFYFLVTIFLQGRGFFVDQHFSIRSLFLEPFFSGHQIPLMNPMWFLPQLFILNIVFQVSYWSKSKLYAWGITVPIACLGIYMAQKGLARPKGLELLIIRTGISAIFFQLGIMVSLHKDFVLRITTTPIFLFSSWMIIAIVPAFVGDLSYQLAFGSVGNAKVYLPILSTSLIIALVFGLSQLFARAVDSNDFFFRIGRDSFWIMALHLLGFFCINYIFYKFGLIERDNLNEVYFGYDVTRHFIFYLGAGLVFPLIAAEAFRRTKGMVMNFVGGTMGNVKTQELLQ